MAEKTARSKTREEGDKEMKAPDERDVRNIRPRKKDKARSRRQTERRKKQYPSYSVVDPKRIPDGPDVLLDVPVAKVDEIDIEVDELRAQVAVMASVQKLLNLSVGADARLGQVELKIEGVEAQALLTARLKNVHAILDRVALSLDRNPQLLAAIGRSVEEVGAGAGEMLADTGEGVEEVGAGAGSAVEDVGKGAGEAVGNVGRGARRGVGGIGRGAGEAVGSVGKGTGQAVGEIGEGAGRGVSGAGRGAKKGLRGVAAARKGG